MKELERWWRWFDGEKPELDRAVNLLWKRCDDTEKDAMRCAAAFIEVRKLGQRLTFADATGDDRTLRAALQSSPVALRDLSLDLCRSFAQLDEQVAVEPPKPKPAPKPAGASPHQAPAVFNAMFMNRYYSALAPSERPSGQYWHALEQSMGTLRSLEQQKMLEQQELAAQKIRQEQARYQFRSALLGAEYDGDRWRVSYDTNTSGKP